MVRRHLILGFALALPIVGAGCHAGAGRRLTKPETPIAPTREMVSKEKFIAQHNRNARAIHSLDSKASIEVTTPDGKSHAADGKLSLDQPHNFSLLIRGPLNTPVANIGSNAEGFWFWVKDNEDKGVYTCAHRDAGANPMAASFQPDWIIEALGLRIIEPSEARVIDARPGDQPGQLVLTQLRKDNHGKMLTKETVVDENNEIREHRLWQGAKAKLLARATIRNYQSNQLEGADPSAPKTVLRYPSVYRLEWVEEKLTLSVTMLRPTLNVVFDQERQAVLFNEPKPNGYKRIDLAALGNPDGSASSTVGTSRIHETRPAPRSGSGSSVRLGDPEAIGDGAMRTSVDPSDEASDTPTPGSRARGVVTAPIPRPVEAVPPARASATGSNRFRGPIFGR